MNTKLQKINGVNLGFLTHSKRRPYICLNFIKGIFHPCYQTIFDKDFFNSKDWPTLDYGIAMYILRPAGWESQRWRNTEIAVFEFMRPTQYQELIKTLLTLKLEIPTIINWIDWHRQFSWVRHSPLFAAISG